MDVSQTKIQPISRSGRFKQGPSLEVQNFSQSVSFDWQLYREDIRGSSAHATMLAKVGLITRRERDQILAGLRRIQREIETGLFRWKTELEDVHMNIEAALSERVPAAAKLHTARSRNDQVATDVRLWVKGEIGRMISLIRKLQGSLIQLALRSRSGGKGKAGFLVIPGYTHLQRAQPVVVAHHLLAYVEMLERDALRFKDCGYRADVCPLGSGAIAGTSLPLDRRLTARLLGFREVSANSMDAVSDRDFMAEFLFSCSLTGIHLSRLAEDMILWSSSEFGFIRLGDSHTTGSSLMPHKKNPDVAELGRGKSGRLLGNLVGLLTVLKGLPMTYNRDLQEDKPLLFDSASTLAATLGVFSGMCDSARFIESACMRAVQDVQLLATELADDLVRQGVPFRKAHHAVGEAVRFAEESGKTLRDLSGVEWNRIHPGLGKASKVLSLTAFFQSRNGLLGSPGFRQVERQLNRWRKKLA